MTGIGSAEQRIKGLVSVGKARCDADPHVCKFEGAKMGDVPQCVLYEHAVGYVLLRVTEFEDIGTGIPQVEESIADVQKFCSVVKVEAFEPFKNTESALENCNKLSESQLHPDLLNFLEANLPRRKKRTVTLAVGDPKLASAISEQITGVKCQISGIVPELMRGIRIHFGHLAKDLPHHSLSKAQISLGHSYSRKKVKFDIHRVDNMVIQSIALLDQLDKDVNLFGMRIREWYSYHFPELFKLVPEQFAYIKCASTIMDRKNLDDQVVEKLNGFCLLVTLFLFLDLEINAGYGLHLEILGDNDKVAEVVEAARTSMGMDISDLDLLNVDRFAKRVDELMVYRQKLHNYVKEPNTPKYGLLFHSSFIGRASTKNKGRISRFLANKCTVASRIDCFSDVPVATYGEHLKQQVEDRLKFLENGTIPKKNLDVMKEAIEEAVTVKTKILKKRKKEAKRAKRAAEQQVVEKFDTTEVSKVDIDTTEVDEEIQEQKAKRPKLVLHEESMNGQGKTDNDESIIESRHKKKKKKADSSLMDEPKDIIETCEVVNGEGSSKKKKSTKKDNLHAEEKDGELVESQETLSILDDEGARKKKKKKQNKLVENCLPAQYPTAYFPGRLGREEQGAKLTTSQTYAGSKFRDMPNVTGRTRKGFGSVTYSSFDALLACLTAECFVFYVLVCFSLKFGVTFLLTSRQSYLKWSYIGERSAYTEQCKTCTIHLEHAALQEEYIQASANSTSLHASLSFPPSQTASKVFLLSKISGSFHLSRSQYEDLIFAVLTSVSGPLIIS
uniref:Nucleolar protein 56 n=1 Tax=Setaria digitata TaxID=48799 RepID=A0A915PHU0_9BILA